MSLRWQARIRACAGSCVPRIAIAIRGRAFPDVFGSDIENKFLSRVCIRTFQVASLGIGRTDVIRIGVANRRKRRACLRCRRSSRVSRQWPGYGLSPRWCSLMSAVSRCNRPFGNQNCRGHTHTRIPSCLPTLTAHLCRGDPTAWLGREDWDSGICARAMYLRCRDNIRSLGQPPPVETVRV